MIRWLSDNYLTIIVLFVLAASVSLIIYKMIKDKKSGRSSCAGSCGGSCSGCAMHENCQKR